MDADKDVGEVGDEGSHERGDVGMKVLMMNIR
jgi:hypothetical protein